VRKKVAGYFTVEAALIMPIVLSVIFVMMYLLFFQYNRCLMEMEMGIFALRGSLMQAETNEDRVELLGKLAMEEREEQYIGWNCGKLRWKLEKGTLKVEREGNQEFPFAKELWSADVNYENHILSPVSVLRYYRKLVGGKDDTN